jgi:hypothetical protein
VALVTANSGACSARARNFSNACFSDRDEESEERGACAKNLPRCWQSPHRACGRMTMIVVRPWDGPLAGADNPAAQSPAL